MRENRREGVGREVRKWGRLFFSPSYYRLILLAFPCRRRLVGRLALRLVSLLACRLAGPVRFRFVVRPVVRPSFSSSPCSSRSPAVVIPCSGVSFPRLVVCLSWGGAIDAMWHGMGRPWLRVMMGMGARPSVVLVLLACSHLPAGIRSSDAIVETAMPPPLPAASRLALVLFPLAVLLACW